MKEAFTNIEGAKIVIDLVNCIQINKEYLGEIDGMIGDGDHGVNMNKGFSMCGMELAEKPTDFAGSLALLSNILLNDIGGSMGPLYGMFFTGMADVCKDREQINAALFGEMLKSSEANVREIGIAEPGDKTMLDTLCPAVESYLDSMEKGKRFEDVLEDMKQAAIQGRDSTKDMIARVGRASRLGERSRGVIDAGAASCCIILCSIADSIKEILK